MKLFFLLLFSLLSVSFVSALEILQDTYLAGESVQAYVESVSLSSSEIVLLDGNGTAVDITTSFTSYREGLYFLYFTLPITASMGNYTLYVENVADSFVVENTTGEVVIQLKPAFIKLNKNDDTFSFRLIEVSNIGTTVLLMSSENLHPRKSSVSIGAGETKDVYVDYTYSQVNGDMSLNLSYGSQVYTLPVLYPDLVLEEILTEENISEETVSEDIEEIVVEEEELIPFVFLISDTTVETILLYNQSLVGDLKLQNTAEVPLVLTYSFTGNIDDVLELNKTEVTVAAGEIYSQRVWFNRANNSRVGEYRGEIVVSDGSYSENISVFVEIVETLKTETVVVEENTNEEVYEEIPLVYQGETLGEEGGNGIYVIGIFLIVLLLVLILLVALKLRQKEDRKFDEYIEGTKKKK